MLKKINLSQIAKRNGDGVFIDENMTLLLCDALFNAFWDIVVFCLVQCSQGFAPRLTDLVCCENFTKIKRANP